MRRTNQGGSVLGFILVAGAIALILIGGLYVVKWQSQQRQQATPQNTPAAAPSSDDSSSTSKTSTDTPTQQAPKSTSKAAPAPSAASSTGSATSADALPHTGPSETFGVLIAIGFLSWSAVAYARSRRAILSF